jgi:hypothetical protein
MIRLLLNPRQTLDDVAPDLPERVPVQPGDIIIERSGASFHVFRYESDAGETGVLVFSSFSAALEAAREAEQRGERLTARDADLPATRDAWKRERVSHTSVRLYAAAERLCTVAGHVVDAYTARLTGDLRRGCDLARALEELVPALYAADAAQHAIERHTAEVLDRVSHTRRHPTSSPEAQRVNPPVPPSRPLRRTANVIDLRRYLKREDRP